MGRLRLVSHDDVHGSPRHVAQTRLWGAWSLLRMRGGAPVPRAALGAAVTLLRARARLTGAAGRVTPAHRPEGGQMDPVVVVGAGPTGLMLAGELRCAGVETILLERLAEPSGQSRALALHARSAEVLEQRGLLGPFLAEGVTWPYIHFAGLKLDMDRLDGRHRYSLHVHQSRVEALLEEAAGKRGADIRRGHTVTGLAQDEGGVEVTVATATGGYRLRCAYLVGCDGGASTVRKLAGIEFPGTASVLWGVLGDVESFDAPVTIREPLVSARGMFGASPLDDRLYRLMCIETDAPPPGDEEPTAEELRAMICLPNPQRAGTVHEW